MICIELDANAKLGHDIIENDPHEKSPNGVLFQGVIERNDLIVGNATQLCHGLITRTRTTVVGVEKSVIDYIVVCEELFSHMIEMTVDENNKYQPSGGGGTRSPPATLKRLQNPKWPPGAPKWPTPRFLGVLSNFC